MGRAGTTLLLGAGLAALAGGLLLLAKPAEEGRPPRFDPRPLGPTARLLQGPLAAGRPLLIPFACLEVKHLLGRGQYGKAKKAARRLLAGAPWLKAFWLELGWSLAYSRRFDRRDPAGRAALILEVEQWLAEAAAALPGDYQLPQSIAFIITDRLPPNSPTARAYADAAGRGREESALAWLEEARRRAPGRTPLAMRVSAVVVDMAARDWAAGEPGACRRKLQRAKAVEKFAAVRGSRLGAAWVQGLEQLIELTRVPYPGGEDFQARAREHSPGILFLRAAGLE